jgi:threonine/homoserine/homoserine lactone efflux protein
MIDIHNLWLFAITAFMLNITPGNDMLYVATRSTSQGVKAGIVSSLGIMAGCMVHIVAAVVGLSAIVAKSAIAFDIIKYIGAAYLIYLGIRSLLNKANSFNVTEKPEKLSNAKIFWQGVLTNMLNPKVALFFLAFLPQFINAAVTNVHWQILFLGTWFNVSGTLVNILVALLFGKIGGWLSKSVWFVKWQSKITGAVLIALGVKVAMTKK